ncbi:MAG TPA: hypothetical protein DCL38_08680 [Lachnospiraceae bacterium]|nr:hypothetical protein [Lachnospiraceae bacterium]
MLLFFMFIISITAFIIVMLTEKRTIFSGFLLLLSAFLLGCFLISEARFRPEWFSEHIILHILLDLELLFLALLLFIYPAVMIPLFLAGGLIIMKKEGIRLRNALSMGLAVMLLLYEIIYPLVFDITTRGPAVWVYWYMTIISLYLIIQLISYSLSNVLNLIHFRKNMGLKYVVVLGAGLSGRKPTPLLQGRIDRGITVYRDNPGSRLIFSGGQGSDELLPESHAMAEYAISAGVPEVDIIREDASVNTWENILFSARLMEKGEAPSLGKSSGKAEFAVVTSSYHVIRALMIARRQKLKCIGYGSRTRLYFSLNSMIREYVAYLRDTRTSQIIILLLLTIIYILFISATA